MFHNIDASCLEYSADRQGETYIPPQTSFAGGITIALPQYVYFQFFVFVSKTSERDTLGANKNSVCWTCMQELKGS